MPGYSAPRLSAAERELSPTWWDGLGGADASVVPAPPGVRTGRAELPARAGKRGVPLLAQEPLRIECRCAPEPAAVTAWRYT